LYRHWGSVQAVQPIGGVQVYLYSFMTNSARRGWWVSGKARPLFTPRKDPIPIVQEAGWAPGPVWTGAENLVPTGIRSPDRPARSQSLYRLRSPAHLRKKASTLMRFCRACLFSDLNVSPTGGSAYAKTMVNLVISGFHREVAENCALLSCYAASSS
jgi:hypothetical protein